MWTTSYEQVRQDGTAVPVRLKRVPTEAQGGIVRDFFAVPPGVAAWTGAILGRKPVFQALGGFRVGRSRGEDTDLWPAWHSSTRSPSAPDHGRYHLDTGPHHPARTDEPPVIGTLRRALESGNFRHTTRRSLEKYLARQLFAVARRCFHAGDRDAGFAMLDRTRAIRASSGSACGAGCARTSAATERSPAEGAARTPAVLREERQLKIAPTAF